MSSSLLRTAVPPPSLLGRTVAVALVAMLLLFQGSRLANTRLLYDDAYLAAAAKSVAFGHGYGTHYPMWQPFDVHLGVGPVLELPAAALIRLFGNRHWVPGLATVLAIDLLLLAIAGELRRRLPPAAWIKTAIAALAAFAVITADADEWILSHWYAFLGDMPAALTVVLGMVLAGDAVTRREIPRLRVGLVFGLAMQIKLVCALAVPAAIAAAVWCVLTAPLPRARALARLSMFVGGVLLPTVAWEAWQCVVLGPAEYRRHFSEWASYFSSDGAGSGLAVFQASIAASRLWSRISANIGVAADYLGGVPGVAAVLLIVGLAAARLLRRGSPAAARAIGLLLFGAGTIHLLWWTALSPLAWLNHLLPGLIYLAGALALSYSSPPLRFAPALAYWGAVALFLSLRASALAGYAPVLRRTEPLVAELQARDYLLSDAARSALLTACGWWVPRDLEYLLPGVGNFQECRQLADEAYGSQRVTLVRSTSFWNGEHDPELDAFARRCEAQTLFRNAYYVISQCPRPR